MYIIFAAFQIKIAPTWDAEAQVLPAPPQVIGTLCMDGKGHPPVAPPALQPPGIPTAVTCLHFAMEEGVLNHRLRLLEVSAF